MNCNLYCNIEWYNLHFINLSSEVVLCSSRVGHGERDPHGFVSYVTISLCLSTAVIKIITNPHKV